MNGEFWLRMLLAALVIVAIWNALGKGMILSKAGDWLEDKWYGKPLGLCPPCAASLHGTWVWLITGGEWTGIPVFVLALSGGMKLIAHNLLRDG